MQYAAFCKNVKHYRSLKHFTQEKLAEESNLSISYIKQIESEKEYKNISLDTIFKISKALNVNIGELFSLPSNEKSHS